MHLARDEAPQRRSDDLLFDGVWEFRDGACYRCAFSLFPCPFDFELIWVCIGSVFYNIPDNTGSFFSRGALLFFAILMNRFASGLEVSRLIGDPKTKKKITKMIAPRS